MCKKYGKALILAAVMIVCSAGVSCGQWSDNESKTAEQTADYCRINGKTIYFAPEEQKQSLKEPLTRLFSKLLLMSYGEGEESDPIGQEALWEFGSFPIPKIDSYGLFDVTGDGTPELLVAFPGGSAGNIPYRVYDIDSGQVIGSMDGGYAESWSVYYALETEDCHLFGRYHQQTGVAWQERYIATVAYDEERGECIQKEFLRTLQTYSGAVIDGSYTDCYMESEMPAPYSHASYYVYGEPVDWFDYYDEYEQFLDDYVRIPETTFQLFDFDEVAGDEEDYAVRGAKMAEALLASSQKFVLPEK